MWGYEWVFTHLRFLLFLGFSSNAEFYRSWVTTKISQMFHFWFCFGHKNIHTEVFVATVIDTYYRLSGDCVRACVCVCMCMFRVIYNNFKFLDSKL